MSTETTYRTYLICIREMLRDGEPIEKVIETIDIALAPPPGPGLFTIIP